MDGAERRDYQWHRKKLTVKKGAIKIKGTPAEYYDRRGVLGALEERPVQCALEEELRKRILTRPSSRRDSRMASAMSTRRRKPLARPVQQQEAPRQYRRDEIRRFLKEDRLDRRTAAKARRRLGRKRPV